jgi:hypothetical protein
MCRSDTFDRHWNRRGGFSFADFLIIVIILWMLFF